MTRVGAVLGLLLCCAVAAASAATGAAAGVRPLDLTDVESPAFSNFSQTDGLPDAAMVSTVVDRDGFVWAATLAGLYRYDGRHWSPSPDPAMAQSATTVFVDHEGRLWATFRNAGLAAYDGKDWHVQDMATGLPTNQIVRLAETRDAKGNHTLWALTWNQGLLRLRDGHWESDPGNASLPADPVDSMAQTQQLGAPGRQWVGTNARGLWYRDPGQINWTKWEKHELDTTQIGDLLPVMQQDKEELWISTFSTGLWRIREDGMRHWTQESGELPSKVTYTMASTALPNGNRAVWVATRAGLLRIHDDHAQVFDRRHGMRSNLVRDVSVWHSPGGQDVLWMATDTGVSRTVLGAAPWAIASRMGADTFGVFGFVVEPDGKGGERLWVGSYGEGLALYQDRHWRHLGPADGIDSDAKVNSLTALPDRQGHRFYLVGLAGGRVLRMDAGQSRFSPMDVPWKPITGESLYDAITRTVDGHYELWAGMRESGIYRWRDGKWTHYSTPDPTAPWRVIRLKEVIDRSGRSWMWAATNQGLARFDGEQWQVFAHDLGLPDSNLIGLSLIPDAQGRQILWAGTTSAGAVRVDVTDPLHPQLVHAPLPTPPDPNVYSAQADSKGRVYLCTDNGVQMLTPTAQGYASRLFGRRDGMVHQECNSFQQVDTHDRYWATTMGGLAVYDPSRELHDTQPKPLRVTGLQVDGQEVPGPVLEVPADAKEFRVDYALLSWFRESESRFRSQLVGYEPAPGPWSDQNFRTFNGLPPGHYRLRIEGRDHAGNLSRPVMVRMVVAAAWWQQTWTRIGALVALALLVYAFVRWRTHRLRAQQVALELRVAERTAELATANARLHALSYRDELTGLDNRRRLEEVLLPPQTGTRPCSLILMDIDHFKAFNDRFGHLAGDEALRRVAETMRACAPDDAHVARQGGEEFACVLPGADLSRTLAVAECIRSAVAACTIKVPGQDATSQVTLSAGVAIGGIATREDVVRLFNDADLALYQAKAQGRDRVQAYVLQD